MLRHDRQSDDVFDCRLGGDGLQGQKAATTALIASRGVGHWLRGRYGCTISREQDGTLKTHLVHRTTWRKCARGTGRRRRREGGTFCSSQPRLWIVLAWDLLYSTFDNSACADGSTGRLAGARCELVGPYRQDAPTVLISWTTCSNGLPLLYSNDIRLSSKSPLQNNT